MKIKSFFIVFIFIVFIFFVLLAPYVRSEVPEGFVYVRGGTFTMGSDDESYWMAQPPHRVTVRSFYMAKYPVTQEQYQAVMGTNPSWFYGGRGREPAPGESQGRRPVEMVSWYDVHVFANRLSISRGLTPVYSINGSTNPNDWGEVPDSIFHPNIAVWSAVTANWSANGYRLPTEAEWEFAARGGNTPGNFTFSGSDNPDDVAWHNANSDGRTREVGRLAPNGLGIYDMSGNVCEWVWDWFGEYTADAKTNPHGPNAGSARVMRSGSWDDDAEYLRSANRSGNLPWSRFNSLGFRLVRNQ
ncbi:MAG: formylglycine-generating enzyme family protein [Spirochaetes bacterium]|nr:formylglycine-generating enzyme family protein [Spirochaetota bacterium]